MGQPYVDLLIWKQESASFSGSRRHRPGTSACQPHRCASRTVWRRPDTVMAAIRREVTTMRLSGFWSRTKQIPRRRKNTVLAAVVVAVVAWLLVPPAAAVTSLLGRLAQEGRIAILRVARTSG